jgi:hypothetical protein
VSILLSYSIKGKSFVEVTIRMTKFPSRNGNFVVLMPEPGRAY